MFEKNNFSDLRAVRLANLKSVTISDFTFLRDAFDVLYAEGGKMMSCGLHMRLIGHPARIKGLRQFMDYVQGHPGVWLCKRSDVAKHWMEHFPYEPGGGGSDADVSAKL